MYATFDEWVAQGYYIIKGSKSTLRDPEGRSLFSRDQVDGPRDDAAEGWDWNGGFFYED